MDLRGPHWIRHACPYPIANAWHSFLELSEPAAVTAVAAVEVALRFVSAAQVSNLLAEDGGLPKALSLQAFEKPSLGTWLYLVKEAGKAIRKPFMEELCLSTPESVSMLKQLDLFVQKRNDYHHAGQKSATWWGETDQELIGLAVEVLGGLEWLGRARVLVITSRRESAGRMKGRIKVFDSYVSDPVSVEHEWVGDPAPNRVYLASPDSEDQLLDLEPFLRWTRLTRVVPGKADGRVPLEALCLWNGFDKGKVLLSDDRQDLVEPQELEQEARRLVPCRLGVLPERRADMTASSLAEVGSLFACEPRRNAVSPETSTAPVSSGRTGDTFEEALGPSGARQGMAGSSRPSENPFAEHPFLPEFVDRFCRGEASEDDLAMLDMLAKNRAVSVRALIAVFNVYGAFYRYEFKSELWLNDLYYGAGAVHLPESCRAMIGAYRTEGEVPGHLERVRDRVKQIWRAVK